MLFSDYTEADKIKLGDYFLANIFDTSQNSYLTQRIPLLKMLPSITVTNPSLHIYSDNTELEPSLFDFSNLAISLTYCPFYVVANITGYFTSNTQANNITFALDVPESQNSGTGISDLKITMPTASSGITMNQIIDYRWYYESSSSTIYSRSGSGYVAIAMLAEANKNYKIVLNGSVSTTYPVITMLKGNNISGTTYYYSDVYAMDTTTSSIAHVLQPTMDMIILLCAKYTRNTVYLNYGGPLITLEGESGSSNQIEFIPSIDSAKLILTPKNTITLGNAQNYNLNGGAIVLSSELKNYN